MTKLKLFSYVVLALNVIALAINIATGTLNPSTAILHISVCSAIIVDIVTDSTNN